jgi:predicted transcriptional regulator
MGQKRTFSTRIDDELLKALKHLAVDTDKSLGELLEEAIRELMRKYAAPKQTKGRISDALEKSGGAR